MQTSSYQTGTNSVTTHCSKGVCLYDLVQHRWRKILFHHVVSVLDNLTNIGRNILPHFHLSKCQLFLHQQADGHNSDSTYHTSVDVRYNHSFFCTCCPLCCFNAGLFFMFHLALSKRCPCCGLPKSVVKMCVHVQTVFMIPHLHRYYELQCIPSMAETISKRMSKSFK